MPNKLFSPPSKKLFTFKPADALAGFAVAGILLPEAIAYASIARLSIQAGITALLIGLICYALLGMSRFAIVSPTSSSAALVAAAALSLMPTENNGQAAFSFALVILTGCGLITLAVIGLGRLSAFISRPVLYGFSFALAITIIIKQLPVIVGVQVGDANPFIVLMRLLQHWPQWSWWSSIVGLIGLVLLAGLKRYTQLPAAFIVLTLGIALAYGFDLAAFDIATVNQVNLTIFTFTVPDLSLKIWFNAGVAALVGAIMVGRRIGYGKESMAPHSLTMTMIGTSLLWVGWFGFNAGSALEAGNIAALAFVNTILTTATSSISWAAGEWIIKGKPSLLGVASGAIAGLVAVTPACGYIGPIGALVIGLVSGPVCLWAVNGLKHWLGIDDSLDVFGVHGVGGALGAILTGVFAAPALGGQGIFDYVTGAMSTKPYSILAQLVVQAEAVVVTVIWSGVVSFIAYKLVDLIIGLRVSEDQEREGLDIASHGESAYHN